MRRKFWGISIGFLICVAIGFSFVWYAIALNPNMRIEANFTALIDNFVLFHGLWHTFFLANLFYAIYMLIWNRSRVLVYFVWFFTYILSIIVK